MQGRSGHHRGRSLGGRRVTDTITRDSQPSEHRMTGEVASEFLSLHNGPGGQENRESFGEQTFEDKGWPATAEGPLRLVTMSVAGDHFRGKHKGPGR